MTHLALIWIRMLRFRVALMIWMFMLLAVARHGGLASLSWDAVWGMLVLSASYVAATTANDLADREIDLVNHPRDRGRPLVSGEASPGDLVAVNVIGAVVALGAAVPLGLTGLAIAGGSLTIGYAYSVGPVRLSFRTYLAPVALAAAYVLVPYAVGLLAIDAAPDGGDGVLASALFVLFLARIVLKDFRDRVGDARFGKPTLLLRFGKDAVCLVSLVGLVVGDSLLVVGVEGPIALGALLQVFVFTILLMLRSLWRSSDQRGEQVAIGLGARMGNGLLLAVMGWLALRAESAPDAVGLLFVVCVAALYSSNVLGLAARPQDALIGYKG